MNEEEEKSGYRETQDRRDTIGPRAPGLAGCRPATRMEGGGFTPGVSQGLEPCQGGGRFLAEEAPGPSTAAGGLLGRSHRGRRWEFSDLDVPEARTGLGGGGSHRHSSDSGTKQALGKQEGPGITVMKTFHRQSACPCGISVRVRGNAVAAGVQHVRSAAPLSTRQSRGAS